MNKSNSNPNQGMKIDMVNESEMTEADRQRVFDRPMSVDAIPDLDILTSHIYEILEYLYKDSTDKLLKSNESAVKMYLNNKYADTVPYGIITLLMEKDSREKNVEGLMKLFENLSRAKKGEIDLDTIGRDLSETVNQRYLYNQYGSKEAFEQELTKQVAKDKKQNRVDATKSLKPGQLKMTK